MFKLYAQGGGKSTSTAKKAGGKREGTVAKVANKVRSTISGVARRFMPGNKSGRQS